MAAVKPVNLRLAMVAGEASGDLLAGLLLSGINARWAGVQAGGIGGTRMIQQGFQAWWPSEKLSVFGYVDALRNYRELVGIRNQVRERVLRERPDVFIGVDAPDFNFGLETPLRASGIRTVHFVCPSIWAWRANRVTQLAQAADHVLCLFPFEPALLARHGVQATYVGHPVADQIAVEVPRALARSRLGLSDQAVVVAVLPGSRRGEIRDIAPAFLQAAALMHKQRPELKFILPVAPGLRSLLEPLVRSCAPELPLLLLDGCSHEALAACDVTLIASGTATLEAALFKRPMVIGYRLHWLNWLYMKHRALLPWVGLPNILLRDFAVPELLQDQATPEALAREVLAWLDDPARCERLKQRFTELHHLLRQDTASKASDAIQKILEA